MLEDFVTIAECGSINKAAQMLFISQPHLSNKIMNLEGIIGYKLFIRTNRGVKLTPEGETFLSHAKVVLDGIDSLKKCRPKSPRTIDKLRVSMTMFSHTMESFNEVCSSKEHLDEFNYLLNEGTTKDVIKDVSGGYTDIGVIHYDINEAANINALLNKSNLVNQNIAKLKPEICLSRHHEIIRQGKKVTLDTIKDYGFVRYIGQYEDFIYNITNDGFHMDLNESNKIVYVYGRASLLQLISSSNFYTIGIMEFDSQDAMYHVISVPIEDCKESIVFDIIRRKDSLLNDTEKEFISNVSSRYKRLEKLYR